MLVNMLGGDHVYSLGATSFTLSSAQIGTRDNAEMIKRVSYYVGLGYDQTTSLAAAIKDYDKDHATTAAATATTSRGSTVLDSLQNILKENPGLQNLADPSKWAQFVSAAKGKGYNDADIAAMHSTAASQGFDVKGNMPWLIIGGAALVAVLFMAGTRR